MSGDDFVGLLKRVARGETLNAEQSALAFQAIMAGEVSETRIAALVTAMAMRNATVDEIVGAVRAMRGAMNSIEASPDAIDLCGTGGDGIGTLNISTACAFVVAACGVPVAKHGNRNMSSKSGTADCLEALGVTIDLSPAGASQCLRRAGLCFLFAQAYHPAIKYAASVRRELGFRTIFNLIGPLSNPARVRRQLVGVYDKEWIVPLAEVLGRLGADRAWVVHGDGLDEIAISGPTSVAMLLDGKVSVRDIGPEDAGLSWSPLEAVAGGTAVENAAALRRLLAGETGAYRDIVLINSAAALIVAGKATDLKEGVSLAGAAIDQGEANAKLEMLIAVSKVAA
jgi:anthranilate phosphoribosyltransferase